MIALYRTARPPIEYRANVFSLAFLFHVICVLIQIVCPVVIAILGVLHDSSVAIDSETPAVVPGKILRFSIYDKTGRVRTYPLPEGAEYFPMTLSTEPIYDGDKVTEWSISVVIPDYGASEVVSVDIAFTYTAVLSKWAKNTVTGIGSFSRTFPIPANDVAVSGDLVLEQNEIVDFRGSFESTSLDIPDNFDMADLLYQQDNLSTLFYVDWEKPTCMFGFWDSFRMKLRIRVGEVKIAHSIPLVSSIEHALTMYLSTTLLATILTNTVKGWVFRNGLLKTWPLQMYASTKRHEKVQ